MKKQKSNKSQIYSHKRIEIDTEKDSIDLDASIKPSLHSKNKLNNLTASEWIPETISVWTQRGLGANHPDAQIERQHPAPFSFTDVSRLVRFFTKRDEVVLDPFVGVGSTLKACALEGRKGIGFELNRDFVSLAKKRLLNEVDGEHSFVEHQKIITGDSRLLIKTLTKDSIDFIVTSPPYWNILHKQDHKVKQERIVNNLKTKYSNDKMDIGNIHSYPEFLKELSSILGGCASALKQKKYMSVIVSDFRNKSKYIMFHSDLVNELSKYKLEIKGITILYQRHKRIFPYGYPFSFVPNIHHQYILIFQNMKE